MGTVNKSDLAREIAEKTGKTKSDAVAVIEALFDAVKHHAEQGNTVSIPSFGRFQVKARAARIGRNPRTGEPIDIPETRKLVFKATRPAA